MRAALSLLAGIALGLVAFATAQSIATADWVTAVPLALILTTGIVLIAPRDRDPSAAADPSTRRAAVDARAGGRRS
jgi:hypothetical protein